jgi:hypothetical protein
MRDTNTPAHLQPDGNADLDSAALLAYRAIDDLAQEVVCTVGEDQRVKVHRCPVEAAFAVQCQGVAMTGNIPSEPTHFEGFRATERRWNVARQRVKRLERPAGAGGSGCGGRDDA